nr:transcriptional repressor [uncultured Hyphomonas sp.]
MPDFNAASFLEKLGLRATRPRQAIARILFADGQNRHVTAEWLAEEVSQQGEPVALATIYNTLHSLADAGALRMIRGTGQDNIVFDTYTRAHHHFLDERTGELTDIPDEQLTLGSVPVAPDGRTIAGYDIVIRIR